MAPRIEGEAPKGYTTVKLYNDKTKKVDKTFYIPVGKKITFGDKTYDPSKTTNNELVITGNEEQDNFKLIGWTLEHMDVNKDGKIDTQDTDQDLAQKFNKQAKNTPYYVKETDEYSDAGVYKGEGGVVFSKDGKGQVFGVDID